MGDVDTPAATQDPEVQTDAQADADFDGGFVAVASAPTEPTASPAAEETQTETPETTATAEQTEPAAEPTPKYRQITEDEYTQLMDRLNSADSVGKRADTALGKIGGLERTIRELQEATPKGQAITLSEDDFEEMKADFPDIAKMTVAGFNRALAKIRGTGPATSAQPAQSFDPKQIDAMFSERLGTEITKVRQEVRQEAAMDVVDSFNPNWRQTVNTQEWKDWVMAQPEAERQVILNSWRPSEVLSALTKFNDHITAAAKKPAPKPKADPKPNRFASNVAPKSTGGMTPAQPDEDDFDVGYKKAAAR